MNLGLLPYPMDFFPPDRKAFVLRDLSAEPPALAAMTSEQIEAFLARRKVLIAPLPSVEYSLFYFFEFVPTGY